MMPTLPPTFDSILPGVLPMVPDELIGPESRTRIQAIASRLPAILAGSTFGFECPLATNRPEADFLVSASGPNGAAFLSETAACATRGESAPAWSSVAELARLWAGEGRIDNVWLEFDLARETPFVPNLFFQPVYETGDHNELNDILSKTGPVLLGCPISPELAESLKRSIVALPERARIFQVGAMRARSSYGLRLCVDEIYLDRILFLSGTNRVSWRPRICAEDLYCASAAEQMPTLCTSIFPLKSVCVSAWNATWILVCRMPTNKCGENNYSPFSSNPACARRARCPVSLTFPA